MALPINIEEMQSPFEAIREMDSEGAIVRCYQKNFDAVGQMG